MNLARTTAHEPWGKGNRRGGDQKRPVQDQRIEGMDDQGRWHLVHSDLLQELLNRAFAGESPDLLYVEMFASTFQVERNTDTEQDASEYGPEYGAEW